MHPPVRKALSGLGLIDREIDVYLTLLSVRGAAASTVAQRTGIPRSTAQYTCQQLVKRGIAAVSRRKNAFVFVAEPPEKLLLLLKAQQEALQRKEEEMQRVVGSLRRMMDPDAQLPTVQFYEGRKGMAELYEDILGMRADMECFEDGGQMRAFFPECVREFAARRIRSGARNRVICPSRAPLDGDDAAALREVRMLPAEDYPFTCDITVCRDLVGIFSFQEDAAAGIAIRHAEIARNFRLIFERMWTMLERQ